MRTESEQLTDQTIDRAIFQRQIGEYTAPPEPGHRVSIVIMKQGVQLAQAELKHWTDALKMVPMELRPQVEEKVVRARAAMDKVVAALRAESGGNKRRPGRKPKAEKLPESLLASERQNFLRNYKAGWQASEWAAASLATPEAPTYKTWRKYWNGITTTQTPSVRRGIAHVVSKVSGLNIKFSTVPA
jgi:hypothetical protein